MTASLVGLVDLQKVLAELPDKLEANVLRGAMKAGAEVIAEEARERCRSADVRKTIKTKASVKGRIVKALIQTKDGAAYMAPWLEYGTLPHVIAVRDGSGRTARAVNRAHKKGSLLIGGAFVGDFVWHKGAKPYPFMRPALDQRRDDAVTVIGEQIAARLAKIDALPVAAEADE